MTESEITEDQRRLLYLIGAYANAEDQEAGSEHWFKDGALLAALYELTVAGVFETYDYSAMSIMGIDGFRRFMNVSQEGMDDLNDLRELGLIDHLNMSTTHYGTVTAYRLTPKGIKAYQRISLNERAKVDKLIRCPSCKDQLLKIESVEFEKYEFRCQSCNFTKESGVFKIEDVSYISKPRFLKLPYRD